MFLRNLVCATALTLCCMMGITQAQEGKLGHAMPQEHPQAGSMDKFIELVGQYTDGRVKLKAFPGGVLGGDDKMMQSAQTGTLEVFYGAVQPVSGRVKEYQIFDFPFLFNTMKEVDYVFYGPLGEKLNKLMEPLNLIPLGWGEAGFRHLSNSRRAIKSVNDLNGLKIRVMQNTVALETWKAMGANAVPMSYAEVFTALENKTLDGQENPLIHMYANKMQEVQKYITLTGHVYTPCVLAVNSKFWEKIKPEDQAAMRKAAAEAFKFHRKSMTAADADVIAKLEQGGVKVEPLPPEELAKIRGLVKPVIDKFIPVVGEEFAKEFFAEIEKARNGASRPGAE
ncbi:ABC transporter substrate-binding protein [Betaproteobacteria bacterium]|nr:ABC transporter substrate-binding protein [Betaproteobacteria bacterium]